MAAADTDTSGYTPQQASGAGLGWVPKDHPLYGTQGYIGYRDPAAPKPTIAPGTPPAAGGGGPAAPDPAAPPRPVGAQTPLPPSPVPQIPMRPQYQTPNTINVPGSQGTTTTNPDGTKRVTSTGLQPAGDTTGQGMNEAGAGDGQTGQGDPMQAAVRSALMGMLGQDVNQASVTDADLAPQSQAYAAAVQRQAGTRRAELAEQAAAQGSLSSGGFEGRLDKLSSDTGQAIGANDASLIGDKLQMRRDQLNQAIQVAKEYGLADQQVDLQKQLANLDAQLKSRGMDVTREGYQLQRDLGNMDTQTKTYLANLDADLQKQGYSLQERLAQMDAEIRKLGINTQGDLGQLEIALKRELGIGGLNLDYMGLLMNAQQTGNAQGITLAQLQYMMDRDAVMTGMGPGGG